MKKNEIRKYIKKGDQRIGVLVARKSKDGTVRIGWSAIHPSDSERGVMFNRDFGVKVAIARTSEKMDVREKGPVPRAINKSLAPFVNRAKKYFRTPHVQISRVGKR